MRDERRDPHRLDALPGLVRHSNTVPMFGLDVDHLAVEQPTFTFTG
ncbi:MAG: hypothetical protein QOC69_3218 [Mycobacterium sp.]|jgi:hypothetical protein|nr:hypothetical protein [Mycobacterium sp.]